MHAHTYSRTYVHTYIRTHVHTYTRTHVHTYIRTYIHASIHTHVLQYLVLTLFIPPCHPAVQPTVMVLGPISDHPYVGTGGVGTDAAVVFGVDHPYIYVGTGAVGTDAVVDADVVVIVFVAVAVLAAEEIGGAAIVAVILPRP